MAKNVYLTTTLPYVNADPHIGFALEIIQADAFARFQRSQGAEVFFNTGTDEHGQKIFEASEKAGKGVQEYVDYYANEFQKLKGALNLSNDTFIRTTNLDHHKAAQEMWKRCEIKGDIYKKEYEGLYCVGCERFITEKDLVDGKCVDHGKEPELLKEENYFFRFSNYEKSLLEYLSREDCIIPEWRRQEAINFVKAGLEDFSISREKKRLQWGVPVPGDDSQVMYVWFDALTNYISTLGWPHEEGNFKKFWVEGVTYQFAGKDQVRFQSLMWQAMLMSAEVKNTDHIFYHGFINSDGKKMSKSIGNVISPYELVKKYGTDATRYLLLRHVHPFEDADVTWERLDEWYTAGLVNGIGNLASRIMQMAETHLTERPAGIDEPPHRVAVEGFNFNEYMNGVWKKIQELDEAIQREEPFKKIKQEETREDARTFIAALVNALLKIGYELDPVMPDTARAVQKCVFENKKPENLFPRLES